MVVESIKESLQSLHDELAGVLLINQFQIPQHVSTRDAFCCFSFASNAHN